MNKNNKRKQRELLHKSTENYLTPEEKAELNIYQQSDEGQQVTAVLDKLTSLHLDDIPESKMNRHRVKTIANQIEARVQQKQRRQRIVQGTRTFALATAVFVFIFVGMNWYLDPPFMPGLAAASTIAPTRFVPTATPIPTETPMPTATLRAGHRYVDLTTLEPQTFEWLHPIYYTKSIDEVQESAGFDVYLPTQLGENFQYIGAMNNYHAGSVEIAFMTDSKIRGDYPIWILSQKPVRKEYEVISVLTLAYQPYNNQVYEVHPTGSKTLQVYGTTGLFEGNELVAEDGDWTSMNQLWWQTEDRQFSLTMVAPANINGNTLAGVAQNFAIMPPTTE